MIQPVDESTGAQWRGRDSNDSSAPWPRPLGLPHHPTSQHPRLCPNCGRKVKGAANSRGRNNPPQQHPSLNQMFVELTYFCVLLLLFLEGGSNWRFVFWALIGCASASGVSRTGGMSDLSICNGALHMHTLHLCIEELRERRSSTEVRGKIKIAKRR